MIKLTDAAIGGLKDYFSSNDKKTVRVYLSQGGCSGPGLALGLDEKQDSDSSFDFDGGITVVMNKELLDEATPVTVDMGPMGFAVHSSMVFENTGGGCSGCSGGCG